MTLRAIVRCMTTRHDGLPQSPRGDDPGDTGRIEFPSTGCLVAGIPHLLGFVPAQSVIVVALSGSSVKPVVATMRIDLPRSEDGADRDALVDWIDQPMANAVGASCAFRVIIWTTALDGDDVAFVNRISDALQRRTGLETQSVAVWRDGHTGGALRWRALKPGDVCGFIPCGDPVTEADSQQALVAFSVAGRAPASSREDVESELSPVGLTSEFPDSSRGVVDDAFEVAVAHAIAVLHGYVAPEGHDLSLLVSAFMDVQVRDTVLHDLMLDSPRRWVGAAGVLTTAVRMTSGSGRAPLATCLAVLQWQMGDGARAIIAIDAAIDADPDYSLAHLVGACISGGVHPKTWRRDLKSLPRRVCAGGRG